MSKTAVRTWEYLLFAWQNNVTGEFGLCFCLGLVCSQSDAVIFLVYVRWCPILFSFLGNNLEQKVIFHFPLDQRTDQNRSLVNKWMAPYEWVHKYRSGIFNKLDSVWVTVLKIITKASTAPFASASRNIPLTYTRTLTVWIYSIYGDTIQKHTHIWLISMTKQQHPEESFHRNLNEEANLAESAN